MKIQKGIVKYKDRSDIVCVYGITDEGKQYYFLGGEDKTLSNGNRIASTALVEAIDPMVKASNIGLIDAEGREVIPFENKSIKLINDAIILVEKAQPVSQSVIEAINAKGDPAEAARLVSTPATIKGKLNAKMGPEGRYYFNDQFSEATVCDINGNNLISDEFFSFIGMANGKLYFSKNTEDSEISEYSILPPEVQSDVTPTNDTSEIDVSQIDIPKDVIEDALNSVSDEIIPTGTSESADAISVSEEVGDGVISTDVEEESDVAGVESSVLEDSQEESRSEDAFEVESHLEGDLESSLNAKENADDSMENDTDANSDFVSEEVNDDLQEEVSTDSIGDIGYDSAVEEQVSEENDSQKESDLVAFANSGILPETSEEVVSSEADLESEIPAEEEIKDAIEEAMAEADLEEASFNDKMGTDEEVFKDSILQADSIDKMDETEDYEMFGDGEVGVSVNDNIMSDVANSMNSLINLNKKQKEVISQYKNQIDKLNFTNRSTELKLTKSQAKNKVLEEKLRNQEQLIARQAKELEEMRPQLVGKDELVKLLADAQVLLGQESYDYSDDDSLYRKVA